MVLWGLFKDTMTKSQDKAFRRISELKEQIQLDQLAKFDLEQNYMLMLEEKDEVVKVLRTQVFLVLYGYNLRYCGYLGFEFNL